MRKILAAAAIAALALSGCFSDDCPETIEATIYGRPYNWDTTTVVPDTVLVTVSLTDQYPARHFDHVTKRLDPKKGAKFTLPVGKYFLFSTTKVVQGDTSMIYLQMGVDDGTSYSAFFLEALYKVGCEGVHFTESDISH